MSETLVARLTITRSIDDDGRFVTDVEEEGNDGGSLDIDEALVMLVHAARMLIRNYTEEEEKER